MTIHLRFRAAALVAGMATLALPLRLTAQKHDAAIPATIPSALVRAVLELGPVSQIAFPFTVGQPPATWPSWLRPPAGATIVGGYSIGPFQGTVVSAPRSAGLHSFDAMLQREQFHAADTTHAPTGPGFESGLGGSLASHAAVWCRDSTQVVAIVPLDSSATRRVYNVMLARAPGMRTPGCNGAQEDGMAQMHSSSPLPLPPLRAPLGATVSPAGGGYNGDSMNSQARADTALSSAALLTHYTAELVRGGWTPIGAPALGTGSALQSFSTHDAHGAAWRGALIVMSGPASRRISIEMARDESQ